MALDILNPDRGLIFRIVHRDSARWALENGLHCRKSQVRDPNFVSIGNADLIEKRHKRVVPIDPGGTLSDYVPFYFTPASIMLMNIETGYGGIKKQKSEDILFFVSSLKKLKETGVRFLFTDRHASLETAKFYDDTDRIDEIDWKILRQKDFSRDMNDLGKKERYQAEILAHRHVPVSALLGIACRNSQAKTFAQSLVDEQNINLPVHDRQGWYFR